MLRSMENFFFYQPVKADLRTYDNILKIVAHQGDDLTTVCLLIIPISKNIISKLQ